jgi:hypothetical protein
MEERAATTPTTRLAARDPGPRRILIVVLAGIAIAVAKPWVWGQPTPEPAGVAIVQPASNAPTATPPPDPRRALGVHCPQPSGWRVYAHELWSEGRVRSWKTLTPATTATGPLDPSLPVVPVSASVTALGYCAPWTGAERAPADATLSLFLVTQTRSTTEPVAMSMFVRTVAPDTETTLGGLYAPVGALGSFEGPASRGGSSSAEPTRAWPPGRYVFALRSPGWERWWVVVVDAARWQPVRAGSSDVPALQPPE